MATLAEMDTVYSLEDAFDMLEVISIDHFNQSLWSKFHERG